MSSPAPSPESSTKDNLRRAIRKIKTTFRKADGQGNRLITGLPIHGSSESLKQVAADVSMDTQEADPYEIHRHPLVAADCPGNDLPTSSDVNPANPSSVLSLPPIQSSSAEALATGEWTYDRATAHNELASRLMSRYGMDIKSYDRSNTNAPPVVHRVQRAPRMRIHRACHKCGIEYGHHKECRVCGHAICKLCPRSSGRRVQAIMNETSKVLEAQTEAQKDQESSRDAVKSDLMDISAENEQPTSRHEIPPPEQSSIGLDAVADPQRSSSWKSKGPVLSEPAVPLFSELLAQKSDLPSPARHIEDEPAKEGASRPVWKGKQPMPRLIDRSNIASALSSSQSTNSPDANGTEEKPLTGTTPTTCTELPRPVAPSEQLLPGATTDARRPFATTQYHLNRAQRIISHAGPDAEQVNVPPSTLAYLARSRASIHYSPIVSGPERQGTLSPFFVFRISSIWP